MNIIRADKLTKQYGDFKAVNGISFTVEKGELLGFLGVNGAGKSTTINMLSTLIPLTSGSAEICGFDVMKNAPEIRRRIGIVYQQNCLDDMLTVKENLICRGVLHGASSSEAKAAHGAGGHSFAQRIYRQALQDPFGRSEAQM